MRRVLFVTHHGYVGLASKGVKKGDMVTVLLGGDMPYLLRNVNEQVYLEYIGEVYVHDLMYREAMNDHERDERHCVLLFLLFVKLLVRRRPSIIHCGNF